MSRDYYTPTQPYLYTAQDSGSGGSGGSGLGPGSTGMDCLQPLRCPPTTPGPFHYLISEQAKSLVALQELQNEVGALLEFRDLVIETFPNLRNKMAAAIVNTSSSPVTMTSNSGVGVGTPHHHQICSNIPIPRRDWEPGIRVRRKIQHKDSGGDLNSPSRSRSNSHSGKHPKNNSSDTTSVVQDSGFSTETSSSKEAHSASSTSGMQVVVKDGSNSSTVQAEDELWNLLDVIQRKGTKLRDEVEALQGALCNNRDVDLANSGSSSSSDFHQQILLGNTPQDVINLRRERDILLEKLADMESENLAGRVQASRLRADLETLLATKIDLEEQLRAAITQKTELNSRIHELHMQFVKSAPSSPESTTSKSGVRCGGGDKPTRRRRTLSNRGGGGGSNNSQLTVSSVGANLDCNILSNNGSSNKELLVTNFPISTSSSSSVSKSPSTSTYDLHAVEHIDRLNEILGHGKDQPIPKVRAPDSNKIAAILQEHDPLVLQKSLLTVTVHNQALKQRLDIADKLKGGLEENLKKAREHNEDLKFQLEEKVIELEGTKAHVRVLERFQYQKTSTPIDSDLNPNLDSSSELLTTTHPTRRTDQLSTPSMKAMTPLALTDETNPQNNSSTESAHDQKTGALDGNSTPRRKPSRIPLPGAQTTVPIPSTRTISTSSSTHSSKNASSLPRPGSAQSGSSLSGAKSSTSIPLRSSLTGRLRNDSLSKTPTVVHTPGRSSSVCNKRDGLTRVVRRVNNTSRNTYDEANNTKIGKSKSVNDMKSDEDPEATSDPLYSDSLNDTTTEDPTEDDSISEANSHHVFETANNFLWSNNTLAPIDVNLAKTEYFDSINSGDCMSSGSLQPCGEGLAECCDSLESELQNIQ